MRFLLLILTTPFILKAQTTYEQRVLIGTVLELGTNRPIPYAQIQVSGSDGTSQIHKTDSIGRFIIPLTEGVTFQIAASSNSTSHPCDRYGQKSQRYFSSEKALIRHDDLGQLKKDLFLEVIPTAIDRFPILFKLKNDTSLTESDKLKLNTLIQMLNDNPTLTCNVNNYKCDSIMVNKITEYIISREIDSNRIEGTTNYSHEISCDFEWNNKERFPDLKEGMKITEETIKTLSPKTQEYFKKYLNFIDFRIVRTDYSPNDEPYPKR